MQQMLERENKKTVSIYPPYNKEVLHPESLKEDLDRFRASKKADAAVLSVEPMEFSVEKENKNLPASRFYTRIRSARIEGFFHKGKSSVLYVMFGGSRTRSGGKALAPLPSFYRWSWYQETDASLVSLEDPMFYTFPECTLGWYYGTKEEDYRQYCARCIGKIAELLNIENRDIVLYGSSGGGTAAIGVSRYLTGCSVVAINPQIFLEKYPYTEELENITGMKLCGEADCFMRNDNCKIMMENLENTYFLIENVRSDGDYKTQLRSFCDIAGLNPEFGISKKGNIVTWLYDAPGAPSTHSSVENTAVFKLIDLLVRYVRENEDIGNLENLYDVVNEFWHERYTLMRSNYYQNKNIADLKAENERMKKELDWGWIKAGVKLKKFLGKVKRSVKG